MRNRTTVTFGAATLLATFTLSGVAAAGPATPTGSTAPVPGLSTAAPPERAIMGIADSDVNTFIQNNQPRASWSDLKVQHVRAIVPYHIALLPKRGHGSPGHPRRNDFDDWLTAAENAGLKPRNINIGLQRITKPAWNVGQHRAGQAPDEALYKAAFRAFLDEYGSRVRYIGPWNEPNLEGTGPDEQPVRLPDSRFRLDDPDAKCGSPRPTIRNCGPKLAASYYRWALEACARKSSRDECRGRLIAGEFAGKTGRAGWLYIQRYKQHLGDELRQVRYWSIHNYSDVVRFQISNTTSEPELRTFLRELYCDKRLGTPHCGDIGTQPARGRVWIGATGAYSTLACPDPKQHIKGHPNACKKGAPGKTITINGHRVRQLPPENQARAATFITSFFRYRHVTRIYYFTFIDDGLDDTGLLNKACANPPAAGCEQPRPAYNIIRDWAARHH